MATKVRFKADYAGLDLYVYYWRANKDHWNDVSKAWEPYASGNLTQYLLSTGSMDSVIAIYEADIPAEMDGGPQNVNYEVVLDQGVDASSRYLPFGGGALSMTDVAGVASDGGDVLATELETGVSVQKGLQAILAGLSGVLEWTQSSASGAGVARFYAPNGSTLRLTVTIDGSGNRTVSVVS